MFFHIDKIYAADAPKRRRIEVIKTPLSFLNLFQAFKTVYLKVGCMRQLFKPFLCPILLLSLLCRLLCLHLPQGLGMILHAHQFLPLLWQQSLHHPFNASSNSFAALRVNVMVTVSACFGVSVYRFNRCGYRLDFAIPTILCVGFASVDVLIAHVLRPTIPSTFSPISL